jgi:large subunit ribosomal protein L1
MTQASKRYIALKEKLDQGNFYGLEEAARLVPTLATAKFDESVEIAVRLGVDPRQADQNVRGTLILPHGTGKIVRVLVFAVGEKQKEAEQAGADFVGGDELIKKVGAGWLEFDRAIATPDLMGSVGKIGKILGPRGLMPNPKLGTVTFEVAKAVQEAKAGKLDYRVDKAGIVHLGIGKVSFGPDRIAGNARAVLDALLRAKPASAKGNYLLGVTLCSTMGPGVQVNPQDLKRLAA